MSLFLATRSGKSDDALPSPTKSTNKDYLEIIRILVKLTTTHPELVTAIGLCNFDSATTAEVCEFMLAATGSVGIVSNQVQVTSPLLTRA